MYCSHCGANIPDDSAVCPQCMQPLNNGANQQGVQGQPQNTNYNQQNKPKSKLAAGLLQIFLGSLGIGRFYLGYTGIAVAQLVVSICTCGVGAIWPFIDGILILTGTPNVDANGIPLGD